MAFEAGERGRKPFPFRLSGAGAALSCFLIERDYFLKMTVFSLHPHWMQCGLSSAERTWISYL